MVYLKKGAYVATDERGGALVRCGSSLGRESLLRMVGIDREGKVCGRVGLLILRWVVVGRWVTQRRNQTQVKDSSGKDEVNENWRTPRFCNQTDIIEA